MLSLPHFYFVGSLCASKALMNRFLILQSYFPELEIQGESQCDDVVYLKQGIQQIKKSKRNQNQPIDCGHGGSVLRFLSLLASRKKGIHEIKGSKRLFLRPKKELFHLLRQLDVQIIKEEENSFFLQSFGWNPKGDSIYIPSERSSQFASAFALNAWNLKIPLYFSLSPKRVSESYWKMTLNVLKSLGLNIETLNPSGEDYYIPPHQKISKKSIKIESDVDSAFMISALAALSGKATLLNFPSKSLQPSAIFPTFLKKMGVPTEFTQKSLKISKCQKLLPLQTNLKNYPDLFPVLSVLTALASGTSHLWGAPHLKYKESNRIEKIKELLIKMKRKVLSSSDGGLIIEGIPFAPNHSTKPFDYDPENDHRLAMAALITKQAGFKINIKNVEVVKKSFPELLSIQNIH